MCIRDSVYGLKLYRSWTASPFLVVALFLGGFVVVMAAIAVALHHGYLESLAKKVHTGGRSVNSAGKSSKNTKGKVPGKRE